jgi:AraC-like DNA-binding protein
MICLLIGSIRDTIVSKEEYHFLIDEFRGKSMVYQTHKFERFVSLVEQHTPREGPNYSSLEGVGAYKASATKSRHPIVDVPAIWIVGQGKKLCYVGDQKYEYSAGIVLVMFYPMAVETEIVEASPEVPLLVAGVAIDLGRMAEVLLRLDRIDGAAAKPVSVDPSAVFSIPLNDNLLDPFIRLFESLSSPRDAAMLGDAIVDEIYYRLLCDERGGELRFLLQQRGPIQLVAKAVEHIHQNLDKPVSVDQLAKMVHMSRPTFYENFRAVMHSSPLQYAKSVKLDKAQALIKEGKKANEAGYLVGYNSPAQFSREYKRHFGFTPSAT